MQDRELYRQILGVESPWKVERVELRRAAGEVHVYLEHGEQVTRHCLECDVECGLHDQSPTAVGVIATLVSTKPFCTLERLAATAPNTPLG